MILFAIQVLVEIQVLVKTQPSFWFYWFTFCGIIMGGYFVTAASISGLIAIAAKPKDSILANSTLANSILANSILANSTLPNPSSPAKLQTTTNQQKGYQTIVADIKLSVLSVIFFAFGAACFMVFYGWGITKVYTQWQIQGLPYLFISYFVVLLLQDTYFYFTHRLFHLPIFFKFVHQGHHRSRPPTPWTFFALEPIEALAQASFLLLITLVIPLHVGVLLGILFTMTIWATGNHLGFQIVPYSRSSFEWGRWCIGSAHHLVHHQRYTHHYGLYFTFWDKLLGTQDADYEANVEAVSSRSSTTVPSKFIHDHGFLNYGFLNYGFLNYGFLGCS
ncbi:MAG: sterol desaturase family protein [Synechococcales cyanobacterium CRU_2_2]|nr:sterol desaturase family protein [Synechococcales cyanobacterium CRU_2_2]